MKIVLKWGIVYLHPVRPPGPHNPLLQQFLLLLLGNPKQIQQIPHTLRIQPRRGSKLHLRLRMERHTQAGHTHHRQIIRPITHTHDLVEQNPLFRRNRQDMLPLLLRMHNLARQLTSQRGPIVGDNQVVREGIVQAELLAHPAGQGSEAAAQHGGLVAEALQRGDEFGDALVEADAGSQVGEDGGGDPLEQLAARAQAGFEVELAVHGGGGYGGDFFLHPDDGRDLVDDFLLDERAVHVEHGEALVASVDRVPLEDAFDVPFLLEAGDGFVAAQGFEGEGRGGGGERKDGFDDAGVGAAFEGAGVNGGGREGG